MRTYKAPKRICPCGTEWVADNGGSGRRTNGYCDSCYPAYRRATKLLSAAQQRAKKYHLPITLSVDWLFQRILKPCPKTGMPFDLGLNGKDYSDRQPYSPSIDKINPTLGYTPENCQVVCWLYNCAKQRFSEEDVYDFCLKVVSSKNISPAMTVAQATD